MGHQNSYIRTVTNTRPIPSDFSKTKPQEPFPAGQAWRPQQLPGCCLLLLIPKGCFPGLPIPGFPSQALHLGARLYLDAMAVFVNDCCHSYQDGVSFVHSLQLCINLESMRRTLEERIVSRMLKSLGVQSWYLLWMKCDPISIHP